MYALTPRTNTRCQTTLLRVLAGERCAGVDVVARVAPAARRADGADEGDVDDEDGGRALAPSQRRRLFGYVAQEDVLHGASTLREAALFAAALRGAPRPADAADAALAALGLGGDARLAATRCAALSGGQRRRLAVALALAAPRPPPVLLLDEPTSGLDAAAALAVVAALAAVAEGGEGRPACAVLASLHSPSSEAFGLVHDVVLLGAGGVLAWAGRPAGAEAALEAAGLQPPPAAPVRAAPGCGVHGAGLAGRPAGCVRTPCERLLFAAADGVCLMPPPSRPPWPAGGLGLGRDGADAAGAGAHPHPPQQRQGGGGGKAAADVEAASPAGELRLPAPPPSAAPPLPPLLPAPAAAPLALQLRLLLRREAASLARSPALAAAHWLLSLCAALWLGGVYWHPRLGEAGLQARLGACFLASFLFSLSSLSACDLLHCGRPLLAREAGRLYHPAAAAAALLAADGLALRAGPALLFAAVANPMLGFQPAGARRGAFAAALVLQSVASAWLAHLLAALAPAAGVATLAAACCALQAAVFGGLLTNTAALPPGLAWLRFASPSFYAFEALAANELAGLTFDGALLPPRARPHPPNHHRLTHLPPPRCAAARRRSGAGRLRLRAGAVRRFAARNLRAEGGPGWAGPGLPRRLGRAVRLGRRVRARRAARLVVVRT